MKHHSCPPGLRLSAVLYGLAVYLCGCSSSYTVSSAGKLDSEYSYREMNEELEGESATIKLKGGRDVSAKKVTISGDSVSWVDEGTNEESKASIPEIDRIVLNSSSMGALEGAGFGLVGGGGLGALVGQIIVGNDGELGTGGGAAIGLVLGGGTGLVVGSITGSIIGHSYDYEFPAVEQSDSLQE